MRKFTEKYDKNLKVIMLGHTATLLDFCSNFQFTWDLHDATYRKNNKTYYFYRNGIFMHFLTLFLCKIIMSL